VFHYKQSTYYGEAKQFTIKWDDPAYKIWWPKTSGTIISQRDLLE
jgi:dTDP-4-dehydrorhamnose 3,5-epimerase